MVMTLAKITAGTGYTYLTRHTARGDTGLGNDRDSAAYYATQGNPPGRWTGRSAPLLGLAGREVTEDQMRALFGIGAHPNMDAMIDAYMDAHWRPWMTGDRLQRLAEDAVRHTTLGRPFPVYQQLEPFTKRVDTRLDLIRQQTHREPTEPEIRKVKAEEAHRQRAAVAGFDLVFSPVKSAALLWALDERPQVRNAIRDAHEEAKNAALELLEDHAALTRIGTDGVAQIATNGLIAAEFEHWDSRAGDPNLHTHVAISSKVLGVDGKWHALDARPLYRMIVAASETYNTAFEAALTVRLGVTFAARPDTRGGREPVREIAGVPFGMVEFFSRRRAAIEGRYAELVRGYRDEHGSDPPIGVAHQLAQRANLDTRQGKKPPRPLVDKRAAWREELTMRFGAGAVAELMKAVPSGPRVRVSAELPVPVDLEDLAERTVASVSARRSTWTVWNIHAEVERLLRTEVPVLVPERHRELAAKVTALAVSPAYSISVEAPAMLDEPAELRRADGEPVFTEHAAGRFTSQRVLDAETRLANAARTPTATGLSGVSVAAALDGFEARSGTTLDAGQRDLVTAFASDSRLLLAGIGPAGSGKTTAMRALAYVLRHGGRNLIPLATSATAAGVLGRELGARAENLHKFLYEWNLGLFAAKLRTGAPVPEQARMFRLGPDDVVLVDEAGMAGTFLLDELVSIATARGAVVRLLGDDRQLPAVESGGALRLVAAQPGTPLLTTLYRFRDAAEAAATLKLRTGDGAAVDWYHRHGRIRSGSRESMTQAAYDGWKNDMLAGKVSLMAAADSAHVTELSAQSRADRVAAGQVEASGVRLRDGNLAGCGDWVVTRLNDRRLSVFGGRDWVKNGDAWRVERRFSDGELTVRHLSHGGRVRLPPAYVRDQVQLLYATTAHRAQGTTVDTAHPLITQGMTREALYVLATRARERTVLYVATHDLPFDDDARVNQVQHDPGQYAGREILLNILAAEGAALPATETIITAQEEAWSLATLVPRYLHAVGSAHLETTGSPVADLLPWVPGPRRIAADRADVPLDAYLDDAAVLITARVNDLADAAVRHRPPWMNLLGLQPVNPDHAREWFRHVAVVAAYRDQRKISTVDPRQIIGPYVEPGHAGHEAYRHAAEAVLAARRLANGAATQVAVATKQTVPPEPGRRQPVAEFERRAARQLPRSAAADVPEPIRQPRRELLMPPPAPAGARTPRHGPR
jgi:conjugative relaxase-like TrwC/TraI family protein